MRAERTPHALGHALGAFRSLSRPSLVWSSSGERTSPGYVTLDGSPGGQLAVNPNTASVYVPIACTDGNACDQTAQNVVDVLSSTTCTASVRLDCGVVATAFLGANGEEPVSAIVDPRTDTVYVGNAGIASASPPVPPSISVLDGATCNASVTSGCSEPLATIELTGFPAALALDPATGTLYVASPFPAGAIFVIDAAGCNATTTTGCTNAVKTINDSPGPNGIALDTTTNTVYAANSPPNGSGSVSVVNGSICNAVESSGCNQNPPTITVGIDPFWDVVDQATHTVYVANHGSGTVSVINGATCNATNKSGCNQTPPAVTTGPGPSFVSLDASRHTVFTLNEQADTMSAIDTSSCNGASTLGCPKPARDQALPFNPPQGGNPNVFAFVAQTGTAYLVTAGGESLLQPANITGCSAVDTITCRAVKPTVPQPLFFPVVDSTTHTIYAGDMFLPQIDVLNSDTCQPAHLSGCALVAKIPMPDPQANLNAIDETTHTLYAADPFGDTISVINTATCNGTDTAGCGKGTPKITTGFSPGPPLLDTATHTLYTTYGSPPNVFADQLGVINAATCNSKHTSGCGDSPFSVPIPGQAFLYALSQATNTLYAPSTSNGTVSVIKTARCNAKDHSGCGLAANVRVGSAPSAVAVNDSTHTVYVGNGVSADTPGTVSIIDTKTCNGADTTGCTRTWPTVDVGRGPNTIEISSQTGVVYVSDSASATISTFDGHGCNAQTTRHCPHPAATVPIAGAPSTLAIDEQTNTIFASTGIGVGSASLSVFTGAP